MESLLLLLLPVVLLALAGGFWLAGVLLPVHRLTTRSIRLPHRPELVWAALTDIEGQPQWRRGLRSVSRVPTPDGAELWRETHRRMAMTLHTRVEEEGRVLERQVVGRKLDFGGVWRFELEPAGGGTRLTITEAAELYRPMHRVFARLVLGRGRMIERFQQDLARELSRHDREPQAAPLPA